MKIIFMGTPEFAVPSLEKLIEKYNVEAVVTQPDRPKGRGNKVTMSQVKQIAIENEIPVYQPLKIKNDFDTIEVLKKIQPDFIIVVAFGQILPKEVLSIPKYGCINLHASLLPKYRGAAPINWAVINGENISGNTTMLMDVGLDTGDMLLKSCVEIEETTTYGELHDLLMKDGAELLVDTIQGLKDKSIVPQRQDDSLSCYAPMIKKETCKIDWNKNSKEINSLIKGLNPKPTAYTMYNDKMMKVYEAKTVDLNNSFEPGTIIEVRKSGIIVASLNGGILIEKIQFPGGKPLKVEEFIRGNEIKEGTVLGKDIEEV